MALSGATCRVGSSVYFTSLDDKVRQLKAAKAAGLLSTTKRTRSSLPRTRSSANGGRSRRQVLATAALAAIERDTDTACPAAAATSSGILER
ncbi:ATP-binding protein [Streptomyces sp. NBC_00347]|nr:ATP-binding protein [Streptomyces sp. NBC_00347]